MILTAFLFAAAFLLSFCFSLAEGSIPLLSRETLKEWEKQKVKSAAAVEKILDNRKKFFGFLEFHQSLFSGLYFFLLIFLGLFFYRLSQPSFFAAAGRLGFLFISGFLIYLFFLRVFPRKLAHQHPEKISKFLFPFITFLFRVDGWIFPVIEIASEKLAKRSDGNKISKKTALTDEEIKMLVGIGQKEPVEIEKEEKEMIESVMTFGETMVKEIMIPRIDMICVDSSKTVAEVLNVMASNGYSKLPVYETSIDNIIGIIYLKDVVKSVANNKQTESVKEILRKPFFVPETKKVDDLLRNMQKQKISMAIVVDEYGGTDGLVTMEDLVEEIVGDITDEHDRVAPAILPLSDHIWLIDGKINIEDLNKELNLNLPSEEFETLSGYVYSLMGKVPKAGDKVETEIVTLEVTEIHRQRISKVKLALKSAV
ncbi:MAG: hemolysin family protein [Firmicutes bacterium]|nr:hemolysin family protein [Bacillota bacterium]